MFKKYRLVHASALLAGAVAIAGVSAISASAAANPLTLGRANNFAVVAGGGITNSGQSTLNGDLGLSPVISYLDTGLLTTNGKYHFGDAAAIAAQTDASGAFGQAMLETPSVTVAPELSGQTLVAGIYSNPAGLSINGTVNLDAQNNPNALFILQTPAGLTTGAASHVNLVNGAQACNVFWQVGSAATLGATSDFKGNLLSRGNVVSGAGTTVAGRVFTTQGSVALNSTTISVPGCKIAPPAPVINNLGKGGGSYDTASGTAGFNFQIGGTDIGNGNFGNVGGHITWSIPKGWKFDGSATGYTYINEISTITGTGTLSYFATASTPAPTLGSGGLQGFPSYPGNGKRGRAGGSNNGDGDKDRDDTGTGIGQFGQGLGGGLTQSTGQWINATSGTVTFTAKFTRTLNQNGTAGRVNSFAIGFTGTPNTGVPALPALGALAPVK